MLARPDPPRMLVVDDELPICFALSHYFGARGYVVDVARRFCEAETLLEGAPYSLVITDLRMSGIMGQEGLQVISLARNRDARLPIVLLTGYGSPQIESEARARGANVLLHKPIPLAELASIAESLLAEAAP
jgi:DNA-binding response OmpR family regulator